MRERLIGIDAGGTMTKVVLMDVDGNEIACERRPNLMLLPQEGWTERDALGMWRAGQNGRRSSRPRTGVPTMTHAHRASFGFAALLVATVLTVAGSFGAAKAAGDDSDSTPTCKRGEVYDKKLKKCVRKEAANLSDEDLTDYAYALAEEGRYDETLALLATLRNPNTAKALNYKGYATRKLGRTEEGIGYYLQSVKLDPAYAKVREYLGEAYVIQGRRDLAEEQLATIESLCGTGCEEYKDLAEALAN